MATMEELGVIKKQSTFTVSLKRDVDCGLHKQLLILTQKVGKSIKQVAPEQG
jgi:hypothetical protein